MFAKQQSALLAKPQTAVKSPLKDSQPEIPNRVIHKSKKKKKKTVKKELFMSDGSGDEKGIPLSTALPQADRRNTVPVPTAMTTIPTSQFSFEEEKKDMGIAKRMPKPSLASEGDWVVIPKDAKPEKPKLQPPEARFQSELTVDIIPSKSGHPKDKELTYQLNSDARLKKPEDPPAAAHQDEILTVSEPVIFYMNEQEPNPQGDDLLLKPELPIEAAFQDEPSIIDCLEAC